MNKPLTRLFCFLHTIKHIKKVGLVRNKFLAILGVAGLITDWVVLPNSSPVRLHRTPTQAFLGGPLQTG